MVNLSSYSRILIFLVVVKTSHTDEAFNDLLFSPLTIGGNHMTNSKIPRPNKKPLYPPEVRHTHTLSHTHTHALTQRPHLTWSCPSSMTYQVWRYHGNWQQQKPSLQLYKSPIKQKCLFSNDQTFCLGGHITARLRTLHHTGNVPITHRAPFTHTSCQGFVLWPRAAWDFTCTAAIMTQTFQFILIVILNRYGRLGHMWILRSEYTFRP